jgi:hypothetical protein
MDWKQAKIFIIDGLIYFCAVAFCLYGSLFFIKIACGG